MVSPPKLIGKRDPCAYAKSEKLSLPLLVVQGNNVPESDTRAFVPDERHQDVKSK